MAPREDVRVGLDYLAAIRTLHQRVRCAHPLHGLYEAAELEWFWTNPRSTDTLPQLFWYDEGDQLVAAAVINDFSEGGSALYGDPILVLSTMPDASPEWIAHVVERALDHASASGIGSLSIEVLRADAMMIDLLTSHGFERQDDAMIKCWLDADACAQISPLDDRYRLLSRAETMQHPHHMIRPPRPHRPHFELRLGELSLYRPDLDLVVFDSNDEPAGYGLFWYDPVSATGTVEPMRTHDDHQGQGLARHILTNGIARLVAAGARRISIAYEPDNPASGPLYRSVGFEPHQQTDLYTR